MNAVIHPLKRWLFEHQETLKEFGDRTQLAPGHLSEIINGRKFPSMRAINRITEATSGELTANDFQQFVATGDRA
jgi:transcriptional regulator with XRE-family HTH domain